MIKLKKLRLSNHLRPFRWFVFLILIGISFPVNAEPLFPKNSKIGKENYSLKVKSESFPGKFDLIKMKLQGYTVSGTVVDKAGIPLPGANVLEVGAANGTQTDFDGKFSLTVANKNSVLSVSFVGFKTKEIPIEGKENLNIVLEEDAGALDEVVVVGYGTQEKRHLTGSVGSMDMRELSQPVGDFGQAMYGQVAGVKIQNASGAPGSSSRIQIRGITSLTGSSAPLIVIDGVPMPTIDLNNINSADIASIDILKDAASAAIYGSRAANGVVLVTTKHGIPGDAKVSINYTFSLQTIMNSVEMMNGPQYAQAAIDAAQNGWIDSGGDPSAPNTIEARGEYKYTWPKALENPETLWNTDWEDIYTRVAPMHKLDISTSGGNESSRYYLSGGVLDQEGMVVNSDYQRYSLNINANTDLKEWLNIGGMLNVTYDNQNGLGPEGVRNMYEYPQIYPNFTSDGFLGGPLSIPGFENYYNILYRAKEHPYAVIYGVEDDRKKSTTLGNIFAEINLFPGLTYRSSLNASYERRDRIYLEKKDVKLTADPYPGELLSSMSRNLNYTLENLLTYDVVLKNHNISAVAGYEYNQRDFYYLEGERRDFDTDEIPYLAGGSSIREAIDDASSYVLLSVFGRVNYAYNDKYLFSATIRRDGSSKFGPKNKWGSFPSVSAGWVVSEESFLEKNETISNLKFRASYGLTGNDGFPNYVWISRMQLAPSAFGNFTSTSYYPSSIENPNLAWERTKQFNLGFNLGLLKNRFTVEADYFNSISDGLLLEVPVPTTTGFESVFKNIGELKSHGFELGITSRNLVNFEEGLNWTTQATFSLNRSLITKLGEGGAPITLERDNMNLRNAIGEVPFSFFAYKYDGVYMNQAEIDAHGVEYSFPVHPGDGRYVDVNGDGRIDADDRTIIGNNQADFIWGLNNNLSFKNFDLSFQFGGQVGGEIYNAHARRSIFDHEGRNYFAILENRWRSEQEPGDGYHYKLNVDLDGMEKQPSDYWLASATYARLRNLTFGYNLSEDFSQKIGVAGARVFFNGVNLLNWQEAETIPDPENTHGDNADAAVAGVQWSSYPTAKTFSLGIHVNF